ncbi:hypothetical protein SteCoe_26663 [Stentor coeruleus]|uniref:Uncharacterized protein n=1 Tax=Stentor coeruleus TaxID=5963 RepID=A0A1R2BCB3_9CILI|nr:hypothetical protein SteCoe_26663 [Stentor coeruleus]
MSKRSLTPAVRHGSKANSSKESCNKKNDFSNSYLQSFRLRTACTKDNTVVFHKNSEIIRNRFHRKSKSEITSETAAEVIKEYILPMFRNDLRKKNKTQLSNHKKSHKKPLEIVPGSVYSEITLSEQLAGELQILKTSNEELEKQNKKLEQEKSLNASELKNIKDQLLNLQTDYQIILEQNRKSLWDNNLKTMNYDYLQTQYDYYKSSFESACLQIENANKKVNESKNINDIR